MKISKYEKETILLFNELEEVTSIFTYNRSLKRRLKAFSEKYPELCRLVESTVDGSSTYHIQKNRISIRLVAPYSDERREQLSVAGKKKGFHSTGQHMDA